MLPPPDSAPTAVQEVVITNWLRAPDPAGSAAYSVTTIDPERLKTATTLDGALKASPGFSLFRRTSTLGANPTTQGASLRAVAGSGASRALVTLDGVPQNDPFGGWVIWTALPPSSIDSAEIVRGAGSGPYGAGALTGVVALRSGAPGAQPDAFEASAGELGFARVDLSASTADVGGWGLALDASGQRADGWTPVREGAGPADRRLTLNAFSASARAERDLGPAQLALRVAGYEETRGSGLVGANSASSGAQGSLTLARSPSREGDLGWRLQGWVDSSDLYNTSVATSLDRRTTTPANTQFATPALGWGVNAALRREWRSLWSLELGAAVRGADGESRERFTFSNGDFTRGRAAGGVTLVTGAYLEAAWRPSPWLVTGGLRVDRWSQTDARRVETTLATGAVTLNSRAPDKDGVLPTGRLGVRRELGGGLALRAAGYAGFRPATLNELHHPFRVGNNVTEANPNLDPERLYGLEGGLSFTRAATRLSATVFYNRLEDAITNVTIGFGPGSFPIAGFVPAGGILRQRANAGAVDATGLEADASQTLFGDRLQLDAAVAYTHSKVDGGAVAPQLTGKRPALTPMTTVTASATWRATSRLGLTAGLRYESLRFEDDLNTLRLEPAVVADLRATWKLRPGAEVFVSADNLFDEDIQTQRSANNIVSYDAPRLVRVGLRLTR